VTSLMVDAFVATAETARERVLLGLIAGLELKLADVENKQRRAISKLVAQLDRLKLDAPKPVRRTVRTLRPTEGI